MALRSIQVLSTDYTYLPMYLLIPHACPFQGGGGGNTENQIALEKFYPPLLFLWLYHVKSFNGNDVTFTAFTPEE